LTNIPKKHVILVFPQKNGGLLTKVSRKLEEKQQI